MATLPYAVENIDIGRILSRAFGAIGRHPLLYFGIAIVCLILPGQLFRFAVAPSMIPGKPVNPLDFWPYTLASGVLGVVLNVVVQAMLTHATVTDLGGGRPTFGNCFRTALPLVLPLIGLGLVEYFAVVFGMILFFVPGIILALMWSVAVPALVEERRGVFGSMGRSRALTKGSRWRLFGLFLVAGIILFVPPALVSGLATRLQNDPMPSPTSAASLLAGAISGLAAMLLATIIASAYVELRTVKEGATVESLAAIFE